MLDFAWCDCHIRRVLLAVIASYWDSVDVWCCEWAASCPVAQWKVATAFLFGWYTVQRCTESSAVFGTIWRIWLSTSLKQLPNTRTHTHNHTHTCIQCQLTAINVLLPSGFLILSGYNTRLWNFCHIHFQKIIAPSSSEALSCSTSGSLVRALYDPMAVQKVSITIE